MTLVQVFPLLVAALEACAGLAYGWSWWQFGQASHGWLALTWGCYALACVGLALAGK